jgi:curved DNA-binding protein CbpA
MEKLEKILKDLNNENLYSILGIEKTEEIDRVNKGYKKMIKKYHPDKNKDINAVEIFSKIKKAMEILKDPDLKALYDSYLGRKDEKRKKASEMNKERKKFADDLKEREEGYKNKNKPEETKKHNVKETNTDEVIKRKTFEEKLQSTGIKIKWKKDSDLFITKGMILSYFKEYGTIEDIQIKENDSKAYILFLSFKSVDMVINDNSNLNLRKLFKIKRFSVKGKEQKEYEKEKFKFLDTNTLNAIRNFRDVSSSQIKIEKPQEKTSLNETQTNKTETINTNESIDANKLTHFDSFEQEILEKLRNKLKK